MNVCPIPRAAVELACSVFGLGSYVSSAGIAAETKPRMRSQNRHRARELWTGSPRLCEGRSPMKPCSGSFSSGVRIRPFRITDYDAAVRLWRRCDGVGLNESGTREAIAVYLRRNPRLSFVAERSGRIVGAVLCGHDGRRGYLHHLAVAKRHRGRGIGGRLVSACLTGLGRVGIPRCNIFVFAGNRAGQTFWKRNGWKLRMDIRTMQTRIGSDRLSRSCSC